MEHPGDPRTQTPRQPLATGTFWLRLVAVFGLLAAAIAVAPPSDPAVAGPNDNFSLTKSDNVGGEALIGEEVTYTIQATGDHVSGAPLYNLSFRDVLPDGVAYVSASPAPTEVLADTPAAGQTTVIWSNVSDLPANSRSSVQITVDTNPDYAGGTTGSTTVPVGSTITNNAEAAASLDPFAIPDYSLTTGAFTGDFDGNATASQTVTIIPFRVTKAAPGEMLRGVHGSGAAGELYTVEVENNPDYATNSVTLVDTLHPGLEFLGCDTYYAADNTTVGEEWTGSGPVATGAGCAPTPLSVDTAGDGSTVVTWDLANLTPGQIATVQYHAGIPLFENRPFTVAPSATGLTQGRNLDNNTGSSTGEPDRTVNADPELLTAPEQGLDNVATATGTYTPTGASESASDTHVVESEDLIIQKSMSGSLTQGTSVVTTLTITTSEYRDFTDLVVRDLLPSPLCFSGGFDADITSGGSDWQSTDCLAPGTVQSTINGTPVNVATVRELPDGGPYGTGRFELVWDFAGARSALADLDAEQSLTITYQATVREFYRGGLATLPGEPVLAGDSVTNEAEVAGPDTVSASRPGLVADPVDPDGGVDGDTSGAGLSNGLPSLDKRVAVKAGPLANGSTVSGSVCGTDYATITWSEGDPTAEPGYGPGDITCFELAASFPANVDFEGVQIQDILPAGYTYITGSAARITTIDTIPGTTVVESPNVVTFTADGDGNVEATGNEFRWVIAAEISDNAAGAANDINANLQKLVFNDNGGLVYQLRDQAAVLWTEPEVRLAKGVADVNDITANPADFDGSLTGGSTRVEVVGGDVVTFRVDVWNEGNTDATATEVQDVLPTELTCAMVSTISNAGTCASGVITWTGLTVAASTGPGDLVPDDEDTAPITLTYDLTIPSTVDPGHDYINTAGVARYQGLTNQAGVYDYFPADNIDPANSASENTDRADDQAFLETPAPQISKLQRSGIGEAGNAQNASLLTTADEATIGEIIQYEVTATIPEGTTVYDAEIRDVLPAGLSYFTGSGLFAGTVSNLQPTVTSSTGTVALTGGTVVNTSGTVRYVLPTPYTNAAASGDDSVTITFYAQVDDTIGNQADPTTTFANRANFDWDDSAGNDRPDVLSNIARTDVVEPNPVVVKDHTVPAGAAALPGDTITYRVTITNPTSVSNVAAAHDLTVVDTVPVGSTPLGTGGVPVSADGQLVPSTGVTPAGTFDGVWSETNRTITWAPTDWAGLDLLAPGGTARFTYQSEVDDPSVASAVLTNSAGITAYSLDQDLTPTDDPNEADARTYTDSDDDTITVPAATVVKDIEPFNPGDATDDLATARVGEPVDYEVTVTVPANTAAYDATIFDDLPSRLELDAFGSIAVATGCEVLNPSTGLTTGVSLTPSDIETLNPNGGDASVLAWFIGDVYSNGGCSISVQYTTHVTDVAADGDTVTNDATLAWNSSDQVVSDTPTSLPAGYDDPDSPNWTVDSGPDSESFTVVEPQLEIDKDVAEFGGGALVNPTCDTTTGNDADDDGTPTNGCDTSAGEELRYTVDVRNEGTSPAHDVTFVDTVPAGLTPRQTVGGALATTTGQTITGNSGSVGTWDQTARTITWTAAGPIAVSGSVTVDYDAALDASDDLQRGEELTNTADVDSYFGFSTADRNAIVVANPSNDDIPTYGNGSGATRGSLTPDDVTVEVHFPQLDVAKNATTGQNTADVRLDQPFSWTIVVTNTDAVAPAFDVDLVDVLPVGWTYDASSARITTPYGGPTPVEPDSCSADTGACADAASLNVETLTWNDVVSGAGQPLDPGDTITLTFTATPQSAALTPNQATGELYTGPTNGHTNSVTVAGEDASGSTSCCDPDGPGGTPAEAYTDLDTAEVFVARADISVDKAVSPVEVDSDPVNGPYWFGSYVNYTITVTNDGPDAASGVTVADILDPAALEYDSVVSVDQGTFNSGTNVWTIGAIPNGESRAIVLRTRLVGLGSITNEAQNQAADQYDSDSTPGNDVLSEDDHDAVTVESVPTSLGDYVWLDLNADGVQDGNEPGIPGVEVDLTWLDPATGNPQTATVVTGTDGSYGVPLVEGLPSDTDITATIDVVNSPNLAGLVPTFDRDGGLDNTATDQITGADQTLPSGTRADLAYDFGFVGDQDVGNVVWWDQDASGDATDGVGEEGIVGVTIGAVWAGFDGTLGTTDDIDLGTQTTGGNGDYLFVRVPPGDVRVTVDDTTLPSGLRQPTFDLDGLGTAHTVDATVTAGADRLDVDFSYSGDGSIGDTVWFDHDGDGVIDTGEPGLGGVTVTLDWFGPDGTSGTTDDEQLVTTTATDGTYLFERLPDGNYTVTVTPGTLPANSTQTFDGDGLGTANTSATTLLGGSRDDLDQDFGYRGLGSIGDIVFFDVDGTEADGVPDVGDAPIENVDVTVEWAGVDAVFGTSDDFAFVDTTDAAGNYLVTDLPHGDYRVTVDTTDLPAGLTAQTYDTDGLASADTSSTSLGGANPDDDLDQDFAYTGDTSGLIGDTVWFDANGDGVEDPAEVGFSGVTVDLVWFGPDGVEATADDVAQSTTTGPTGAYLFDNLPEGDFRVSVDPTTLPAGLTPTFDSDGVATANTSLVMLDTIDPSNLDQDFGYTGIGSIGDTVWLDLDASGTAIQDAGEPGLPGIDLDIVWVNPQGDDVTYTVTTDADGAYLWPTAPFGDFTVTVDTTTLPASVIQTHDADGLGTADSSTATLSAVTPDDPDQDFSYRGSGSLGDAVWQDDDADGVIDAGESTIDGVVVTADYVDPGTGATFTVSTVTAGGGLYGFDNLPAGDYVVTVDLTTVPTGLVPVHDIDGSDSPHTAAVALGDGESRTDVDFGYQPQADLAVEKSHTGDFAIGTEDDGVTNGWTIEVTNLGPAEAQAPVVMTDTLPAGTTYVRSTGDDWECSATGQDVTCTLIDTAGDDRTLADGASASVELVVEVAPAAAPSVVNTAAVSTSSVDPNPDNDVDDDRTDVPLSVLAIDKTLDGDLEQGGRASYSLVVTNIGPSSTRGDVVVTDALPTGLSFVSVTTDRTTATCAEAGGVITCTDPEPIAVEATWTIDLTVDVSARAGAAVTNSAEVTGGNVVNGQPLSSPLVPTAAADTLATTVLTPPGILAFTGSATGLLLIISLTLMVAGGAMTALTRRRRAA